MKYKDKAYLGTGGGGIDAAMDRAVRSNKLPIESIRGDIDKTFLF